MSEAITPKEAFRRIQECRDPQDLAIIDVRTPREYLTGHIPGSANLDYHSHIFTDRLRALDKEKSYIIYCQAGVRSRMALDAMSSLGFKEACQIRGGINQWRAEGLPIIR